MTNSKILLTAFHGTSAEMLVESGSKNETFKTLFLPNDKIKDSELLIKELEKEHLDYIISLGQRPNIKNKVHIEATATKGGEAISTAFDCEYLKQCLEQNGLPAKLSNNAGISFCNELYWNGLHYLAENQAGTKMVFVHVPFEKNISDVTLFKERLFAGLEEILKVEV